MKLSIIIPVFNEKTTILEVIKRVKCANIKNVKKEIIVVDDYSDDGTRELLKELERKEKLKIIFHDKNYGKGHAIKSGLKIASGDIVIVQDADLEYNPDEYYELIKPIIDGKEKVVYGSRILNEKNKYSSLSFYLGGRIITFITNFLFNSKLTDEPTCYKVFKKEIIDKITINGERFEWEPEITAKILKKKIKIFEVPISYNPRGKEKGKKIKWVDGIIAIWTLIKYRFCD
ncbi:MAG: glycosyltransferase family 2 protein [Candidatus Pacearchaeota archaeon]|nr:glycosyltransferase family 2 protein [Candidatus Pacearchaeota archaeon]